MRLLLSRNNRYLVVIGTLALLAVCFVGSAYVVTDTERAELEGEGSRLSTLRGHAVDLTDAVRDQEAALQSHLLSRDAGSLGLYEEALEAEPAFAAIILAEASELPAIEAAIDDIVEIAAQWRTHYAEPALAASTAVYGGAWPTPRRRVPAPRSDRRDARPIGR